VSEDGKLPANGSGSSTNGQLLYEGGADVEGDSALERSYGWRTTSIWLVVCSLERTIEYVLPICVSELGPTEISVSLLIANQTIDGICSGDNVGPYWIFVASLILAVASPVAEMVLDFTELVRGDSQPRKILSTALTSLLPSTATEQR
jgi:hypothetical protein